MGSRVMSCSCYRTNVRITLQAGLHQIVLMNVTIQLKIASGGQTFKKFDKQVLSKPSKQFRHFRTRATFCSPWRAIKT